MLGVDDADGKAIDGLASKGTGDGVIERILPIDGKQGRIYGAQGRIGSRKPAASHRRRAAPNPWGIGTEEVLAEGVQDSLATQDDGRIYQIDQGEGINHRRVATVAYAAGAVGHGQAHEITTCAAIEVGRIGQTAPIPITKGP